MSLTLSSGRSMAGSRLLRAPAPTIRRRRSHTASTLPNPGPMQPCTWPAITCDQTRKGCISTSKRYTMPARCRSLSTTFRREQSSNIEAGYARQDRRAAARRRRKDATGDLTRPLLEATANHKTFLLPVRRRRNGGCLQCLGWQRLYLSTANVAPALVRRNAGGLQCRKTGSEADGDSGSPLLPLHMALFREPSPCRC